MNKSQGWVLAGGMAAMIGGLLWAVKTAAIIVTTVEPPILLTWRRRSSRSRSLGYMPALDAPRPRLAVAGLVVAWCAELAAVVPVLGLFLGPPEWSPTDSTVTILTPFITFAALGSFASLLLVGIVIRRTHSLPGWWAALPVVLAVTAVPLILLSPVLQMINERLFNVPTLLIGCEWIALGAAMASRRGASKVTTLLDRSQMAWGDEDVRGVGGAAIRGETAGAKT